MMTRIFGHMVTFNEADRYLQASLRWHAPELDQFHVFDDRSEDQTATIAGWFGPVDIRPLDVPSFGVNESGFRQAAWDALGASTSARAGDWVLCVDADEFVMPLGQRPLRAALEDVIAQLEATGGNAATLAVDEVFAFDDRDTYRRTDGYWSDIRAARLVRYQPDGIFPVRSGFGCGSVPSYARPASRPVDGLTIVHLGYAYPQDRACKYRRYVNDRGHAASHVKSILNTPNLVPFSQDQRLCHLEERAPWRS